MTVYVNIGMDTELHCRSVFCSDGSSCEPSARNLRGYEDFAGLSFEKRKLSVARPGIGALTGFEAAIC